MKNPRDYSTNAKDWYSEWGLAIKLCEHGFSDDDIEAIEAELEPIFVDAAYRADWYLFDDFFLQDLGEDEGFLYRWYFFNEKVDEVTAAEVENLIWSAEDGGVDADIEAWLDRAAN